MPQTGEPLKGLRLLIVEDAADLALSLQAGLLRVGVQTVEMKPSVRQAKKRLISALPPDLVLLDNQLAGNETGMDLALWMRNQAAFQQTLRVSYSGSDPATLLAKCADDAVFHAMITKPISLAKLVAELATIVSRHRDLLRPLTDC